jgi:hypothetical protein
LLLSVCVAWWCWWKCRQDAAVRGFACTTTALAVSHLAALGLGMLAAIAFAGEIGAVLFLLAALAYMVGCTVLTASSAWKYALTAMCLLVACGSLVLPLIREAREEARRNAVLNNLRTMGSKSAQTKQRHGETPLDDEDPDGFRWLHEVLPYIEEEILYAP